VTLDETDYRRRGLRTIPDTLNLIPGVSIQRVDKPRHKTYGAFTYQLGHTY